MSRLLAAAVANAGARIAARSGPVHAPTRRSNHVAPTPSGGGLGIVAGVMAGLIAAGLARPYGFDAAGAARMALLVAITVPVAAIGLLDDLYEWSPRLKFALLSAASVAIAYACGPVSILPGAGSVGLVLAPWLAVGGATAWAFTTKNATNFMDGSNGLVGGTTVVSASFLAVAALLVGASEAAFAAAVLAGAAAGFLPVNAPVARVFMGDAGSLFIGGWYAGASLLFIREAPLGAVYLPPLLYLPILADTLLTMAWHVRHRAPLLRPHRNHAYQVRIDGGESHADVARVWAARGAGLGVLALAAWGVRLATGEPGWTLAAFGLGVVVSTAWWLRDHAPRKAPEVGR